MKNKYSNIFLEKKFDAIKETCYIINLFYKTNIFDEIIEFYNIRVRKYLFNPKIQENHNKNIQTLRVKLDGLFKKEIAPDNIDDKKYKELVELRKNIIKTKKEHMKNRFNSQKVRTKTK